MAEFEVMVFGDAPPEVGEDAEGGLTNAHPAGGGYEMPLRTAKALARHLGALGLFAAVVNEGNEVVWIP
jgi:hypothetical protein